MTSNVDATVDELARNGVTRFRPSYIASRSATAVEHAHTALNQLAEEGSLIAHFELVCPNDECHRTVAAYSSKEEIPLGHTITCPSCDKEFEVGLENVWVYYTPSQALLLRVNRERAAHEKKNRCGGSRAGIWRRLASRWLLDD